MVGKSTCSLSARHGGGKSISFFASAMRRLKKTRQGVCVISDGTSEYERWRQGKMAMRRFSSCTRQHLFQDAQDLLFMYTVARNSMTVQMYVNTIHTIHRDNLHALEESPCSQAWLTAKCPLPSAASH